MKIIFTLYFLLTLEVYLNKIAVSWEKETEDEKNSLLLFFHCFGYCFYDFICLYFEGDY